MELGRCMKHLYWDIDRNMPDVKQNVVLPQGPTETCQSCKNYPPRGKDAPRQPGSIQSPARCSHKKAPPPYRGGRPHSRPRRSPENHSPQSRDVKRFATVKGPRRQPVSECDPNLADQGMGIVSITELAAVGQRGFDPVDLHQGEGRADHHTVLLDLLARDGKGIA